MKKHVVLSATLFAFSYSVLAQPGGGGGGHPAPAHGPAKFHKERLET
jgi:hypothetical protein